MVGVLSIPEGEAMTAALLDGTTILIFIVGCLILYGIIFGILLVFEFLINHMHGAYERHDMKPKEEDKQ